MTGMVWPVVCGMRRRGGWWLRVLGYGVIVKQLAHSRLLFSERNGLARWGWRFGGYYVRVLTPDR